MKLYVSPSTLGASFLSLPSRHACHSYSGFYYHWSFLSFIIHNNWITLFLFTCIDLPLLVFMSVRLTHVVCDHSFLFYIALQLSTVCLLALGHFQLLAIMIMLLWAFLDMPLIAQIDRNFVRCMSKYWLTQSWTVKFFSLKKSVFKVVESVYTIINSV